MSRLLFPLFLFIFLVTAKPIHAQEDLGRTGVYTAEPIGTMPVIQWQQSFPSEDVNAFAVGDQLYVSVRTGRNQSTLSALDGATGDADWTVDLRAVVIGQPAYANQKLLLGTTAGLSALNSETGEIAWTFAGTGSVWSSLLVVNEAVFITSERGWFAIDLETGDEIWRSTACYGSAGGVFYEDALLFPCRSAVYALAPATGEVLWRVEIPEADLYAIAVDALGVVVTGEKYVYAIDHDSHRVLWQTEGGGIWSAPVITADRVFAGNLDGYMVALDRENGAVVWRFDSGDWATAAPILIDDLLYFGNGNHIDPPTPRDFYALQAETGTVVWQMPLDGMVISEPSVGEHGVYVTTNNGTLYALVGQ